MNNEDISLHWENLMHGWQDMISHNKWCWSNNSLKILLCKNHIKTYVKLLGNIQCHAATSHTQKKD
jgi:hypothetical protein